jgi:hypothetical protein
MENRTNGSRAGRGALRQRLLPALERAERRERRFKAAILSLNVLAVIGLLAGTPIGRYASALVARRLKWAAQGTLGLAPSRAEVDADLRARRERAIEQTRATYRDFFAQDASPGLRRILVAAKMAPDDVLLRWANGDWTVIFSPLVFQADDSGRAYRMRPDTRSFWLEDHTLTRGLTSFFSLPDTPEVRAAVAASGLAIMAGSYQTTNSWGCRGPEPDPAAPFRVLVLGDSFMQGLFLADDETPTEHLRRYLRSAWGQPVSVLNTGHIGYSPEQYYHTLRAYGDRFRPHFVVVSACPNDFGKASSVLAGHGDWSEAQYWLDAIQLFCRARQTPCLLVAAPLEVQVVEDRSAGHYPGQVANIWHDNGFFFLDPTDSFVDEHLRLMAEAIRQGRRPQHSPLFNGDLHDAHFSRRGAALWGQVTGRRLVLLGDYREAGVQERRRMSPKSRP